MAIPKVLDWLDDLVAKVATNTTNIAKNAQDISSNKALFDTHVADDNRHWTAEDRQNFDRTVHFKGYFVSLAKLKEAYPTALLGDYAIVGGTDTVWVWDDTTSSWLNSTEQGVVISVNGRTGEVILTKTDVGLSNVDNTSDVNKPISTAQQAALDDKTDRKTITVAQADSLTLRAGVYSIQGEEKTILGTKSGYWTVIVGEYKKNDDNIISATQIWINYQTSVDTHIYLRRQRGNTSWGEFVEILTSSHLTVIENDISEMRTDIQTNATDIDNLESNKADRADITEEQADSHSLKAGIYSLNKVKTILGYSDEYWTIYVGGYENSTKGAVTQIWVPYQFAKSSNAKIFLRRAKNSTTWDEFIEVLTTKHISMEELTKMKQYKGYFSQLSDLRIAYPTANNGDYAIVGNALYIWDEKLNNWTEVSGSGGSTGTGKWNVKQYDASDFSDRVIPRLELLARRQIDKQWEVEDTLDYSLNESKVDYKIYLFETYVNMQEETTFSTTTLAHDDGINVIINNESIYSTDSTSGGTQVTSLSFDLIQGWNKIQILLFERQSSEVLRLGIKFTDNVKCLSMDCYHNDGDISGAYVPLVGNSTIEGDVTIEGVVGITSNSYLSYDSDEDSVSFNFLGKPDGERGSSSNPISIENWNRMQEQIEANKIAIQRLQTEKMNKPEDTYSNTKTYDVDDLVIYNGDIYKCITAITTPEEFNSIKWKKLDILNDTLYVLEEEE